jgi:hypothetical protein
MLASPWPQSDVLVLRGSNSDRARADGSVVRVDLYCRDEAGAGTPCRTDVRVDGSTESLEVADGQQAVRTRARSPGRHEVEVSGPGTGHALVVRISVDGALVPPTRTRRSLQARPGRPVVLTVGAPGLVRVAAARGSARCEGVAVREGLASRILALREGPRARIRCEGDADLLVDTGALEPPTPPQPQPPEDQAPAPALPDTELRPAVEAMIPQIGRASCRERVS